MNDSLTTQNEPGTGDTNNHPNVLPLPGGYNPPAVPRQQAGSVDDPDLIVLPEGALLGLTAAQKTELRDAATAAALTAPRVSPPVWVEQVSDSEGYHEGPKFVFPGDRPEDEVAIFSSWAADEGHRLVMDVGALQEASAWLNLDQAIQLGEALIRTANAIRANKPVESSVTIVLTDSDSVAVTR